MQIAVASSQGKTVDLHFGHAEIFHIFTIEGDGLTLDKKIKVTPLSTGDKSHTFNPQRFAKIQEALTSCSKIYCTKIGEKPKLEMQERGIEVIEYDGPISEIT